MPKLYAEGIAELYLHPVSEIYQKYTKRKLKALTYIVSIE